MKFISVCSGIEAASVAWNPLGWEAVAFSEIEPFPCAVLAHHYLEVPNWGDMTKFQEWPDVANLDVLCGGTPCQSFSVAGLRAGLADPRGNLMLTYGAIAAKYRPRWLVWENVPGVLSSNGGRDFGSFLGLLGQLGYGFAYRVLDAQFFGVPQRRRRVFVVGCLGDWRSAAAVLFERHSLSGNPAPRRQAGKGLAPTLSARTKGGGGLGTDFDCDGGLIPEIVGQAMSAKWSKGTAGPAGPAGPAGDEHHNLLAVPAVTHALTGEGFDASEDGKGRGTPLVPVAVALRGREGGATIELGDDQAFALRASSGGGDKAHVLAFDTTQMTSTANRSNPKAGDPCHPLAAGAHAPAIAFDCKASGQNGFGVGHIASTQRAMGHAGSHTNGGGHQAVMTGMQVRRLTPLECERLQGFPDDYTLIPITKRQPIKDQPAVVKWAADGPRYKALGNSWAVPCARWIGERIALVDSISSIRQAA